MTTLKTFDEVKSDLISSIKTRYLENTNLSNINDFNVGSVLNTLIESMADVMEGFYYDLYNITQSSIENIYEGFNFYRNNAKYAVCQVTFNIYAPKSALTEDIFKIPRGTIVTTEDGTIEFEVVEDYSSDKLAISSINNNITKYSVVTLSKLANSTANIQANLLTKISDNPSITNINEYNILLENESASGASDEETIEDYKIRFQKFLFSLRRGTEEALNYSLDTNLMFSGFIYNIHKYSALSVVKQLSANFDTDNYDVDLSFANKYEESHYIIDNETSNVRIFFGSDSKFYNILFVTSLLTGDYKISGGTASIKYYNKTTGAWDSVSSTNISTPQAIVNDLYITYTITNSENWGRYTILEHNQYFIMLEIAYNTTAGTVENFKSMTYPYPGYVDIYCLKNYREQISASDKVLVTEAIEDYKAAGIITNVASATVTDLFPTVVFYCTEEQKKLLPENFANGIKDDIVNYANTLGIGDKFNRNNFFGYINNKYSYLGNIYIYYKYDPTMIENVSLGVYREAFRDIDYDTTYNEKVDLYNIDVFVVTNLNDLVTTFVGNDITDFNNLYNMVAF